MPGLAALKIQTPQPLNDPEACARCALEASTCCRCQPGEEEFAAPLSVQEQDELFAAAPWTAERRVIIEVDNSPAFLAHLAFLFPFDQAALQRAFPAGGRHFRLAIDASGRCPLLGPHGCAVPWSARPLFCRLFPLWPIASQWRLFALPDCLAQREARTTQELWALLETDQPQMQALYDRLRRAWGLDLLAQGTLEAGE